MVHDLSLRLGDSKSPQNSRTFLRILAEFRMTFFVQFNDLGVDSDFFESFSEVFRGCSKGTNNNRYDPHTHVPQFFKFPGQILVFL